MTFLAPLTGLIAAAVAVPALIALYLLKLRRNPVRVSSTLLWERATLELQVNTPLRWLRRSLLLAVQLLALASLLVALARPVLPGAGVDAPRVVFVIDRSASMSARDGADPATLPPDAPPVTRLDAAKQRAADMVRGAARASGGGGVMVVALANEALAVTGLDASPADARAAIASITPTDQPAEPDRLFELLAALRAGEGAEGDSAAPPSTSVVIFSDGDLEPSRIRSLPADISVRLERVGPSGGAAAPVKNLGIVAINARRDHEDPQRLRVFARVLNAGPKPVETTIDLRIDGELVDAEALAIPAAAAEPPHAPGEQSVTFEVKRAEGGLAVVRLGSSDLLIADDAAGLRVPPASRPDVVLVHAPGVSPDPSMKGLLEDMDLAWLEIIDSGAFDRVASGTEMTARAHTISQIDLAVFDRCAPARAPTIPTLSVAGAPPLEGITLRPADAEPSGRASRAWRFTSWQRQHPLLRFASFDAVALAPPGELVIAPVSNVRATVLATGEPGSSSGAAGVQRPLIVAIEREGVRHVIVTFSPSRSTWPAELSFPLVMQNAVDYLASRLDEGAAGPLRTIDPVRVHAIAKAKEVAATGPLSRSVPVGAETGSGGGGGGGGSGGVELGVLELAGVYTLAGADPRESPVAVNLLDPRESAAALVDYPRLPGVDTGSGPSARAASTKGGREVWPWFVLGAFALATLEWVLYALRMRG